MKGLPILMSQAEMTVSCPECGAVPLNGMTCWEQLGAVIAWEYHDPELMAEHFFTVARYNLQHPAQFTDEALVELHKSVILRLDQQVPISQIREHTTKMYNGSKRVLKPKEERHPMLRSWLMTIADVYLPDHPENAAERVRAWAIAVRGEL